MKEKDDEIRPDEVGETPAAYHYADEGQVHTLDDYLELPDDKRTELIDGVFYGMGSPNERHQFVSYEIQRSLNTQLHKMRKRCFSFAAPLDVQLDEDNHTVVQPDLFVTCETSRFKNGRYFGAPEFVAEILSPSSRGKDILIKTEKYRQAGVREYWMVDLQLRRVIVQCFGETENTFIYGLMETVPMQISEGRISVDFREIMEGMTAFFGEEENHDKS